MDNVGSVEIVIKGGRPWGFTLQGGVETRSALIVAKIEPQGKADIQGALRVGDHVLKINDVQCFSLVDATQLIDCAFRTLTILVWRSRSAVGVPSVLRREIFHYGGSKFQYRQHQTDNDSVTEPTSPTIRNTSSGMASKDSYHNLSTYQREAKHTQNVMSTCHSHQTSPDWCQYGLKVMNAFGDETLSSNGSVQSGVFNTLASSPVGVRQDFVPANDTSSNHSRSPRNLTKDSGYETCAQAEHDYVNVEWIANSQIRNRCMPLDSPQGYEVPKTSSTIADESYIPSEKRFHRRMRHGISSASSTTSEEYSQYQALSSNFSFSCDDCSNPPVHVKSLSSSSSKYTGSHNSVYSSTESLSSHSSKPDSAACLRSSKSSISLLNDSKSSAVSYQHAVTSCQYFSVPSAKSTPDLCCYDDMGPQRGSKKPSIYEELASKSGFDFSPMIQRQLSRPQKGRTKSINDSYPAYMCKINEAENLCSLPQNFDQIQPNFRNCFDMIEKLNHDFQKDETSSSLPPPVPARDSSLRFRETSAHEKFPSWPVSLPMEFETNYSPIHSSGHRSNSWTEQTKCPKDFNGSYSRPKNNFQISTQQLHPVQEKHKKNNQKRNALPKTESPNQQTFDCSNSDDSTISDMTFSMLKKHFNFSEIYQKNEKYDNAHSPPERDIVTPLAHKNEQLIDNYSSKYDISPMESSNIYENVRRNGNQCQSTTPLLDRLRLEREVLPDTWPHREDTDVGSEAGTCISSNSSSQETLKWHGSFSDLSSVHTFTRNDSPAMESDSSLVYEENVKFSSSSASAIYSDGYTSLPELPLQNNEIQLCSWTQSNADPYAVTDVTCKQKVLHYSTVENRKKHEDSKNRRRSLRSRGDLQCFSRGVSADGESFKENYSYTTSASSHPSSTKNMSKECYRISGNRSETKTTGFSPNRYDEVFGANSNQQSPCSSQIVAQEKSVSCPRGPYRWGKHTPDKSDARYTSNHKTSHSFRTIYSKDVDGETTGPSNKVDLELKAIQKQAVLSFYHRQTTIAAKDSMEKKARSLSFSYAHESSTSERSSPSAATTHAFQQQRKRILSSNSFSQQLSQDSSCKPTAIVPANYRNQTSESTHQQSTYSEEKPSSETLCRSPTEKSMPSCYSISNTSPNSHDSDVLQKCDTENKKPSEVVSTDKELSNAAFEKNSLSKQPVVQTAGRKALLQKTYSSNASTIVKVLSPEGETLAQNVTTKSSNKLGPKPQVPPKRFHKDNLVPPTPESLLTTNNSAQDSCEEEELIMLDASVKLYAKVLPLEISSSSPELPLPPPPPICNENDFQTDDPFPPPPDPSDLNVNESESMATYCNQNISFIPKKDTNTAISSNASTFDDSVKYSPAKDECSSNCESVHSGIQSPPSTYSSDLKTFQSFNTEGPSEKAQSPTAENLSTENFTSQCESEAIYVNLDFQRELCQRPLANVIPKPFKSTSNVSVTNSATQTSDVTPSLARKNISSNPNSKSDRTETTNSTVNILPNQIVQSKEEAITGKEVVNSTQTDLDDKVNPLLYTNATNLNISSYSSNDLFFSDTHSNISRDIDLPLTYFTTSEPKAKLLTRYCQSFDNKWTDHVELKGQKDELVESLSKKLNVMRLEQIELKEEMKQNEELGKEVSAKIEKLAKPNEVQKYRVHVEESEQITNLLLSLSGRLTRAENALLILPKDAKSDEKNILEAKCNKLSQQLDDAWQLKENIDRRSSQVSIFLHRYLSKEEYADYEHFIKMKPKLLMDAREIDEKIKLGEEQLSALHGTFQGHHVNGELVNKNCDLTVLSKK